MKDDAQDIQKANSAPMLNRYLDAISPEAKRLIMDLWQTIDRNLPIGAYALVNVAALIAALSISVATEEQDDFGEIKKFTGTIASFIEHNTLQFIQGGARNETLRQEIRAYLAEKYQSTHRDLAIIIAPKNDHDAVGRMSAVVSPPIEGYVARYCNYIKVSTGCDDTILITRMVSLREIQRAPGDIIAMVRAEMDSQCQRNLYDYWKNHAHSYFGRTIETTHDEEGARVFLWVIPVYAIPVIRADRCSSVRHLIHDARRSSLSSFAPDDKSTPAYGLLCETDFPKTRCTCGRYLIEWNK